MTSYKGIVSFSRINGSKKLYMSNLNNATWISLRIHEAKENNSFGEKKAYPTSNRPLVELDLSAAQFAELLTTMNVGNGVPCTLRYLNNEKIDQSGLEEEEKSIDVGKKYFQNSVKEFSETITAMTDDFLKRSEDIKMNKKDKENLKWIFNKINQEILSNMPFYVTQFEETAKKVLTESKAEIDAFITGGIVKAGLDALGIKGQALIDTVAHEVIEGEEC